MANKKQININFRQTPRAFRADKAASTYAKVNRNIPYFVGQFSRRLFKERLMRVRERFGKSNIKLFSERSRRKQD